MAKSSFDIMNFAIDKFVLVRTNNAGVHVGTLVARRDEEVVLRDGYRIWRWKGANTLHELATHGADMDEYTCISEKSPGLVLVLGVIEVIETTPTAAKNLATPRWL